MIPEDEFHNKIFCQFYSDGFHKPSRIKWRRNMEQFPNILISFCEQFWSPKTNRRYDSMEYNSTKQFSRWWRIVVSSREMTQEDMPKTALSVDGDYVWISFDSRTPRTLKVALLLSRLSGWRYDLWIIAPRPYDKYPSRIAAISNVSKCQIIQNQSRPKTLEDEPRSGGHHRLPTRSTSKKIWDLDWKWSVSNKRPCCYCWNIMWLSLNHFEGCLCFKHVKFRFAPNFFVRKSVVLMYVKL